jgi:hypothetical protein
MDYDKAKSPEELLKLKSRRELIRICYLIDRYGKDTKMGFVLSIDSAMAKAGFLKAHYIVNDNEDLQIISKLIYAYIRSYGINYTTFVHNLMELYDYVKIHGYPSDCEQTKLKLGG